jgi:iron complex transport system substrate-binding protein
MPRIVSLIASATEMVCALGVEKDLVGRSHECDYPPSVRRLPVCTAPKFDVHGSSSQVDQRVKSILQEGLSVYRVDAEQLRRLKPDVIVTQTQCEVCAVSAKDVELAVCRWLDDRPRIVSLAPNALADVWNDIKSVAAALDVQARGFQLITESQERMCAIACRASEPLSQPRVACLEWIDPLMATGNWMPELVGMAGGQNVFGAAGMYSPWMTWAQLQDQDPDVIVVMPCGFDIARSRAELPALTSKPEWNNLNAVRSRRVFVADGNQYFNRPGPRLVESLEILAEIFHPTVFHFGHEGIEWQFL